MKRLALFAFCALLTAAAVAAPPDVASDDRWILVAESDDETWDNSVSDATLSKFAAVVKRYYWADLEGAGSGTTSGTFDFSGPEAFLDAIEARNGTGGVDLCVFPMLQWRHFNTSNGDVLPSDLVSANQTTESGGYVGAMHRTAVMTRYIQLVEAAYDYFDSHSAFCGVTSQETAGMDAFGDYDLDGYEDELERMNETLSDYAESADFWWNPMINFLPGAIGSGGLARIATGWDEIFDAVANTHTIISSPDLLRSGATAYSGVANQLYPVLEPSWPSTGTTTELGRFKYAGHFQFESYRDNGTGGSGPEGDVIGENVYTMDELEVWAIDTFSNLDATVYTYQNSEVQTFDSPRSGYDLGDGVAAARRPWDRAAADDGYLYDDPVSWDPEWRIGPNGDWLWLHTIDEMEAGSGGSALTLTCSGGAVTATYLPTESAAFDQSIWSLSRTVGGGETCTVALPQPGDAIQTAANGRDYEAVSGVSVSLDGSVSHGPTDYCPHVSKYATGGNVCNGESCCPADLGNATVAGGSITDTGATIEFTTTKQSGTAYVYVLPSATSAPPCGSPSGIIANGDEISVNSGTITDPWTGGSAETSYKAHVCQPWLARPINEVASSAAFTTQASENPTPEPGTPTAALTWETFAAGALAGNTPYSVDEVASTPLRFERFTQEGSIVVINDAANAYAGNKFARFTIQDDGKRADMNFKYTGEALRGKEQNWIANGRPDMWYGFAYKPAANWPYPAEGYPAIWQNHCVTDGTDPAGPPCGPALGIRVGRNGTSLTNYVITYQTTQAVGQDIIPRDYQQDLGRWNTMVVHWVPGDSQILTVWINGTEVFRDDSYPTFTDVGKYMTYELPGIYNSHCDISANNCSVAHVMDYDELRWFLNDGSLTEAEAYATVDPESYQ